MWIVFGLTLKNKETYVKRADLIFTKCSQCNAFTVWRHHFQKIAIIASCCGHVFEAVPINQKYETYKITVNPVNMDNVRILSIVEKK